MMLGLMLGLHNYNIESRLYNPDIIKKLSYKP